jgi:outer membrane lipoprotein LolB
MRARRGPAVLATLIVGALAVSGCASLAPHATPTLPSARPAYDVAGRLSARHGDDALSANFRWHHDPHRDELDLTSPLGQTVARLSGDARIVRLASSDGRTETAGDWQTLTTRGLGWPLPVAGLAYWIQGTPREGAPFAAEADDQGSLSVLRQDGWTIVYNAYAKDDDGISRPARLTLTYPEVELRLVIDAWQ